MGGSRRLGIMYFIMISQQNCNLQRPMSRPPHARFLLPAGTPTYPFHFPGPLLPLLPPSSISSSTSYLLAYTPLALSYEPSLRSDSKDVSSLSFTIFCFLRMRVSPSLSHTHTHSLSLTMPSITPFNPPSPLFFLS